MPKINGILRNYRLAQGFTRDEMADALVVNRVTYRSLENGNRRITPEWARDFEDKTEGRLTRKLLLPEIFGDAPKRRRKSDEVRAA